jgi:UPF0755 protein
MSRAVSRFFLVLVLGAVAVAALGLWGRQRFNVPYQGFSGDEVFVELPAGLGLGAISDRLSAAGVVPDAWTFRLAARLTGSDRRLKAGEYRFAGASTPRDVMARLVAGDVFTRGITFPEGLTVAEMADIFGRSGLGTADDFLAAAENVSLVAAYDPQARSLEGYLFPSTYAWPRREAAPDAVRAMVAQFSRAFDGALRAEAAARGLSVRDVLTLASIIEKETARADERPLVSAVYHNRLKAGMALQCDPTVIYALMLAKRWDGNLRKADLSMRSPYNTYVVRGLPPTPIASPGRASLDAAVRPADVPYLYFVSRNDGTHVFATTLAEHNRNVQIWQKGQRSRPVPR